MVKIWVILLLALSISSCIKIKDDVVCNSPPAAPKLASTTITSPPDSGLAVPVVSPVSGVTYHWLGPDYTAYTGSTLTVPYTIYTTLYGSWQVYAQNAPFCNSDTIYFSVREGNGPACSQGPDSFFLGTYGTRRFTFAGISYGSDYIVYTFTNGNNQLAISLANAPSVSTTYPDSYYQYDLSGTNGYYIEFYDYTNYYSTVTYNSVSGSGPLNVTVNNNIINFNICNISLYSSGYASLASGNLFTQ